MHLRNCLVFSLLLLSQSALLADPVYFGTYTRKDLSKGIYYSKFDVESGTLSSPKVAAEMVNPSFLAFAPSRKFLYAVSETGDGSINSFVIEEDGALTRLNTQPTEGGAPCHVSVSDDGGTVLVANYSGGNVASYRVQDDGSLSTPVSVIQHEGSSVNERRQKGPHAHSITPGPGSRFVYAADLGTDEVVIYRLDSKTSALERVGAAKVDPGSGPRHFTFGKSGAHAYVINELSLTVTGFNADAASGMLTPFQTISTLPDTIASVGSTADIELHPSGKFLYGLNRGHDSIVVYQINKDDGSLTFVEHEGIRGNTPRNFTVHPSGKWLLAAGQSSNTVTVFAIDEDTGALEYTGNRIEVPMPVCIEFR